MTTFTTRDATRCILLATARDAEQWGHRAIYQLESGEYLANKVLGTSS
ncbi:conserved hypothetical protein [Pyrenophora tritici-repentis Pt-1C-BFP]|uniref:Uncharacterized protein n=1 Tax=Pyrenophora tritici-repentis (strain Pt-1C-BFP) TaxID=426418 RepID=B2W298_PYRTR|nr:uncharacterized protein PTRG_03546 [Pyrenophora tritici-repentis Pt-1C-BFP]EDU46384.1 conserved hypothetical protein [Pyrenophora tritici-repentis Pt-1C-BFP]